MKVRNLFITLFSVCVITSCAELSSFNAKVGEIAGQINQTIENSNDILMVKNEFQVNQNVDDVFLKIRREFGFAPASRGANTASGEWSVDRERIFETVPGNYYRVNGRFGSDISRKVGYSEVPVENSLDVTIERIGKNKTSVQYDARGSQSWLRQAESRLKKAVK